MNRTRLARILAAVIATVAVLSGVLTPAAPANAAVVEWGASGRVHVSLLCDSGRLTIAPSMSVQEGATGGQAMTWRFYVNNGRGYSSYSGWSGSKVMPYTTYGLGIYTNYGLSAHTAAVQSVGRYQSWTVLVQVGYWRGSSWAYSGWYAPTAMWSSTVQHHNQHVCVT
jgi:hypothetical protein